MGQHQVTPRKCDSGLRRNDDSGQGAFHVDAAAWVYSDHPDGCYASFGVLARFRIVGPLRAHFEGELGE
ncbi:hypothetical protein CIW53_03095 [Rhodanobacter sp. T12-5]|nr:hypothetical protein CIW53_03095 [Rhodanobacter sp. T12-5]